MAQSKIEKLKTTLKKEGIDVDKLLQLSIENSSEIRRLQVQIVEIRRCAQVEDELNKLEIETLQDQVADLKARLKCEIITKSRSEIPLNYVLPTVNGQWTTTEHEDGDITIALDKDE